MIGIEIILPIVDNFERGFDTVTEEDKDDAFVDGMRKIYAQLQKQMEELGVTPIEALGKEFDPNLHNAVMPIQSEEYEPGIVGQ
ncbi:MAG: nucleotide exchange factor GrpE [Lachnospiraceae bacterium]|nr:nucleotide exchange factor GrpE [Lachnospiraceae bacterium]